MIDEGAVPGLVDCLSHTDTGVQAMTAQALAGLACDSAAREQVREIEKEREKERERQRERVSERERESE